MSLFNLHTQHPLHPEIRESIQALSELIQKHWAIPQQEGFRFRMLDNSEIFISIRKDERSDKWCPHGYGPDLEGCAKCCKKPGPVES